MWDSRLANALQDIGSHVADIWGERDNEVSTAVVDGPDGDVIMAMHYRMDFGDEAHMVYRFPVTLETVDLVEKVAAEFEEILENHEDFDAMEAVLAHNMHGLDNYLLAAA